MAKKTINTYNESSLHNTLKIFYAEQTDGKTEVEMDGHIYDILCHNNDVIEIQTKNLSKLEAKISDSIEKGHNVKLVYPLVYRARIILTDENGQLISKRLSPKKGTIYDIFKELTGLYDLLLNPSFTLEVVTINIIEHRIRYSEPVQTPNKRRRFKKNWLRINKELEEILEKRQFKSKKDYLSLLPENLPETFCAKDLQMPKYSHLILWLFSRMSVIEQTFKKGNTKFYRIVK